MKINRLKPVILAVAMLSVSGVRQVSGREYPPSEVLVAVDVPQPGTWFAEPVWVAGWAFDCDGFPPTLSLWIYDSAAQGGGGYVEVPGVYLETGLARPDVVAYFKAVRPDCYIWPNPGFLFVLPIGQEKGPAVLLLRAVDAFDPSVVVFVQRFVIVR